MRLLVSGITGQLGIALAESCRDTEVELVAVVRGQRTGRMPLGRSHPELVESAVPGDVTAARWGLSDPTIDRLAGTVDAVVNLAGQTNWAGSGRDLYAVNVLGARYGAELAAELARGGGRPVPYCYASSIFVAGGRLGVVPETVSGPDGHRTAYEHSKWTAERELVATCRGARHGEPDLLIARVAALLGDSRTGATLRRNSLYLLAERWDDLPGRLLPVMPGARVDAVPRDHAAACLLQAVRALVRRARGEISGAEPAGDPLIVHLSSGEQAPTTAALLEAARSISPHRFARWVRLLPVSAAQVLWLSANAERHLPLNQAWRNSAIGLRYVGLDRVMDRTRLAGLVDDLPAPGTELLAQLLFDLADPGRSLGAIGDRGLSRFLA